MKKNSILNKLIFIVTFFSPLIGYAGPNCDKNPYSFLCLSLTLLLVTLFSLPPNVATVIFLIWMWFFKKNREIIMHLSFFVASVILSLLTSYGVLLTLDGKMADHLAALILVQVVVQFIFCYFLYRTLTKLEKRRLSKNEQTAVEND